MHAQLSPIILSQVRLFLELKLTILQTLYRYIRIGVHLINVELSQLLTLVRQNIILGVGFKKDHIVALCFILPDKVHGSLHKSKCQLAMYSVHCTHQRQKPNGLTLSLGKVQCIWIRTVCFFSLPHRLVWFKNHVALPKRPIK